MLHHRPEWFPIPNASLQPIISPKHVLKGSSSSGNLPSAGSDPSFFVPQRLAAQVSYRCLVVFFTCYESTGTQPSLRMVAHSSRSQATSTALLKNVLFSEICKVTTWASVHTFKKHYALIHAIRSDIALGSAVFSLVLDSVLKFPPPSGDPAQQSSEVEQP